MVKVATDTNTRSIVKAMTFRLFVLVADGVIIYSVTRKQGLTILLLSVSTITRTILYFIHERSWNAVSWGRRYQTIKK